MFVHFCDVIIVVKGCNFFFYAAYGLYEWKDFYPLRSVVSRFLWSHPLNLIVGQAMNTCYLSFPGNPWGYFV